jgi:hypothetical protein
VASSGLVERVNDCGAAYWASGCQAAVVDDRARYSFWRAFGILPDHQVALEAEYAGPAEFSFDQPLMFHSQASIIDKQNAITQITPSW